MKVLISDKAHRDLLDIYSYIAAGNPNAADALVERIDEKISQLPFIGRERPSLVRGVRSVVDYVIFYLVFSDAITIVRVLDGRRDIDEEFRR